MRTLTKLRFVDANGRRRTTYFRGAEIEWRPAPWGGRHAVVDMRTSEGVRKGELLMIAPEDVVWTKAGRVSRKYGRWTEAS